MNCVVILQARTTSSRLPGKALLPVAGYPSAVLAALRAANRQHPTIFATSGDPSDDVLAAETRKHGIHVFRGPLNDVLARYFLAAANLPDDSIVVRLTGDNVVPDGSLVAEIAEYSAHVDAEYFCTDPLSSRLPHGLGVEAFSAAALRKAHAFATSANDREHVGPWMKRNCRSAVFTPRLPRFEDFAHLRCTIDDADDYQTVGQLFENVSNPIEIGWLELARKLAALPGQARFRVPCREISGTLHSQLVLGTAQLGMDYGRVNSVGKPSKQDAVAIVRHAIAHGVNVIDTARAYGKAETVVGEALTGSWWSRARIVTKLALTGVAEETHKSDVRLRVDASVDASCRALRSDSLDTVLLHNWAHHDLCYGAVWQRLREHQAEGRISILGASVYQPHEALAALADPTVQHLQIPMNILDWRWTPLLKRAIAERPDVIVHARSALLQGILVHPADRWPVIPGFNSADCARKLRAMAEKFGREDVADLCIAYVRSLPWITSVVVGCETLEQLEQNLRLFLRPKLKSEEVEELEYALPKAPEELLNPAKWHLFEEKMGAYAS
jgi:aryl-alcohol dehydrogenase-like predicted oxidoreductase/spore coat polysaccharide biosynthesis protein SpsF (cytidylyltransferase family)